MKFTTTTTISAAIAALFVSSASGAKVLANGKDVVFTPTRYGQTVLVVKEDGVDGKIPDCTVNDGWFTCDDDQYASLKGTEVVSFLNKQEDASQDFVVNNGLLFYKGNENGWYLCNGLGLNNVVEYYDTTSGNAPVGCTYAQIAVLDQ